MRNVRRAASITNPHSHLDALAHSNAATDCRSAAYSHPYACADFHSHRIEHTQQEHRR